MKGISVLMTFVLLVLAHELAIYLKKSGALTTAGQPHPPSLLQASHTQFQAAPPVKI